MSTELPAIDSQELDAVTGGGILSTIGQGALAGALQGAAGTGAALIQGGGQGGAAGGQPQQ